jgi:hypothetical protein
MDGPQIDLWAALIAAIVNMAIGSLWYSHQLFGKEWLRLSSSTKRTHPKLALLWGFLAALVSAYILAFFEVFLGATTVSDGMFVGFLAWLGFIATTQIGHVIWGDAPFKLFLIESGCKLLVFLAMGGILGA